MEGRSETRAVFLLGVGLREGREGDFVQGAVFFCLLVLGLSCRGQCRQGREMEGDGLAS